MCRRMKRARSADRMCFMGIEYEYEYEYENEYEYEYDGC